MKVLIVEDDVTIQKLLVGLMNKLPGVEPTANSDALSALEWLKHNDADLILLDYMMPGLNGLRFLELFRDVFGKVDIPVVMITAADHREIKRDALKLGATDFLTKPVDPLELTARVRNLLELRKSQLLLHDKAKLLTEEVNRATEELRTREEEIILCLARAAEFRDPETGSHILRMAHYSRIIAERLGWEADAADLLFRAAPMHDIGKVGIPDAILLKPGKLTEQEYGVMKNHTQMGANILAESRSPLLRTAAEIAAAHHEKWDGSGYPNGLGGEDIPQSARIVALADVFDALTSVRPYKRPWSLEEVTSFIDKNTGSHFDPSCVEALYASWDQVMEIRDKYQDEATQGSEKLQAARRVPPNGDAIEANR